MNWDRSDTWRWRGNLRALQELERDGRGSR